MCMRTRRVQKVMRNEVKNNPKYMKIQCKIRARRRDVKIMENVPEKDPQMGTKIHQNEPLNFQDYQN